MQTPEEKVAEYVQQQLAAAPPLRAEQVDRLRAIVNGAGQVRAAAAPPDTAA